ncbi:4'-phosphopantetheinyl transferase family protein [Cytobacillus purgationiresistens]|uniref:4'-phosphopantetheinyl transferase n=1 Tax=Cytobacillus purgationiresistens TaxID=863449 RepID=A0ABU0ANW7_9BACI|nr:4'-phosphopantetheinyl transferase superfamily protein [Cytobacillus purgationiresistens]MDQ0272979.1 4'-phosphopantetheinyl transferase [Cytobacillus purgationiresistens]
MEVVAVKLNQPLPKEKMQNLLCYIDKEKQSRIDSFYHDKDKERCLIGDILVRYMVGSHLKKKPSEISFYQNEFGKPFLEGNPLYFNLSHSGYWVVAALDTEENGIDVQEMGEVDLVLAERFYRKSEYMELLKKEENKRADLFYEWWTLKECYLKTAGKGLALPLNSFILEKSECNLYKSHLKEKELYLKVYHLDSFYKMAVSSTSGCFKNLKILTPQELYTLFMGSLKAPSY